MKRSLYCILAGAGLCLVLGATFYPPVILQRLANNQSITVIVPSTGVTNTGVTAQTFVSSPTSTTQTYPFVIQLRTNQNFAIQDEAGNNLFGIRYDAYGNGVSRHWEVSFGSKRQGMLDQLFDMSNGSDIGWRINGDLNQAVFFAGTPSNIKIQYSNTNYFSDAPQLDFWNTYGELRAVSLFGEPVHGTNSASLGAAAGTGGSVAVTLDDTPSDLSVQVTLVTGHTGTTTGTLFTYGLENAASIIDANLATTIVKPVFSAVNANAANELTKVYCVGTGSTLVFSARAALTIDTTYTWNFFICR